MRARLAIVLVLAALGATGAATVSYAAPDDSTVLAQQTGQDPETEGQEGQDAEGSTAETGADAGETEGAAAETGPPWTYQMARIALVMLLLLAVAVVLLYRRLVVGRRRGAI
ncbi:MAG TPA: hypothetical protein VHJ34_02090 [Actinomycetota bacterium]|nr:hypothetical protein [Actinomycetota bacterium]